MCNPSEYGGCESCPEFSECSTDALREWYNDNCDMAEPFDLDDDYEENL